jgi:hypothetical protein
VDVAALAAWRGEEAAVAALLKLDERYRGVQQASVGLEVSKVLVRAAPVDLEETRLAEYKHLAPEWQEWPRAAAWCRRLGTRLGERLVIARNGSCSIGI